MGIYLIENSPMQTSAAPVPVTTGTSIKTMLQIKPGATQVMRILEYGYSFDGSSAATPGKVELIEADAAATVTAFVAADITKLDGDALMAGDPTTNIFSVGTSASGYTSSNENGGSITSVRKLHGAQLIAPTNQFLYQIPLSDEPLVQPAKFVRFRVTFGAAVNCYCYIKVRT